VFKGNYASRAEIVTPPSSGVSHAKALRWNPIADITEAYYGVALYLSPGFTIPRGGWANIAQIHEMKSTGLALQYLAVIRGSDGTPHLRLRSQDNAGGYHDYGVDIPAPRGEWFTVVFHVRHTIDGQLKLWINNQLIGNVMGDFSNTDPVTHVAGFFDAGLYQNYICPAQYVIFDEMIVASTLEAATPMIS
jgi:hypothetical protein